MRTRLDRNAFTRSARIWTIVLANLGLISVASAATAQSLYGVRSQELLDGAGELAGTTLAADALGDALAVGDFNGDGRDDVAAFDLESVSGLPGAGAVHVVYGDIDGLSGLTDQLWIEFDPALPAIDRQASAFFGAGLAAGKFNADAYDDLAIGVPYRDISSVNDAGWVLVVYGSAGGLQTDSAPLPKRFQLGVGGILGGPVTQEDHAGWALAACDFDGNDIDDLAVGVPGKGVGAFDGAGRVLVLYGLSGGLSPTDHDLFDQDSVDAGGTMVETAEADDAFGAALAAGDFNGDGVCDLAIGAPGEDLPAGSNQGFVHVLYGASILGLRMFGNEGFDQTATDSGEPTENQARFASVLAAGDLTGDGADELVIGTPLQTLDGAAPVVNAGSVTVLYGQVGVGIETLLSETYFENDFAAAGAPQAFDYFGGALAIGNFVTTVVDHLDLAIGTPQDNVWNGFGDVANAGSVLVTTQNGVFLGSVLDRRWAQGYGGSAGLLAPDQLYGSALGAGDFDGDGYGDLAVGAPGFDIVGSTDVGALYTIFGELFGDGFESHDTAAWSAVVP